MGSIEEEGYSLPFKYIFLLKISMIVLSLALVL